MENDNSVNWVNYRKTVRVSYEKSKMSELYHKIFQNTFYDSKYLTYLVILNLNEFFCEQDRLTGHGGISSLGGGNSSPYSGAHHHGHRGNGNGSGMPHHGGASLPTASDFQPPYFPPPFPSHHHAPASPQHPGLGQPQHLDYLVGDPYTQTLNTLHQHHYNHLSAAVTAGQRSGDLRRDAEGIHVVSNRFDELLVGFNPFVPEVNHSRQSVQLTSINLFIIRSVLIDFKTFITWKKYEASPERNKN